MNKRWQCTVCGHIHVGPEPPVVCPVCGADRTQFILLPEEAHPALSSILATFEIHPVAAHFPGGLIPTAAVFLLLHLVFDVSGLEPAVFWLIAVATAVVPVSLGSGLHDWRTHFGGQRAPIFFRKIGLAIILLSLGLTALAMRPDQAALLVGGGWQAWLFFGCLAGMLGCVMLLGHYGAILVARRGKERHAVGGASSAVPGDDWSRIIVAQAPDAILAADAAGLIRMWNHGAERIFGVPADKAVGQSLDLIIPETLRQRHWEGWGKVMRTGQSRYGEDELLRVPALRGDGRRFSAEFSIIMIKDESGGIAGVAAILRDVTVQWEREKELRARLDAGRESTPD